MVPYRRSGARRPQIPLISSALNKLIDIKLTIYACYDWKQAYIVNWLTVSAFAADGVYCVSTRGSGDYVPG